MRLISLILFFSVQQVQCCRDGVYCNEILNIRFPSIRKEKKCDMWVLMLTPDLFPREIAVKPENRLITSSYCPKSCVSCPKSVPRNEKELEGIYNNDSTFKNLINIFQNEGYNLSTVEALERYDLFTTKKKLVDDHNKKFKSGLSAYKMSLNSFSIMKTNETPPNALHIDIPATVMSKEEIETILKKRHKRAVNNIDWRFLMRNVSDQKTCGGCWAFAINAAVEGFLNKSGIPLDDSISVQQLLDCDRNISSEYNLKNQGCSGGYFQIAADFLTKTGITSSAEYSFKENSYGICQVKTPPIAPKIKRFDSGFVNVNSTDGIEALNKLMEEKVSRGPVAVGMAVSDEIYQYGEGIFDGSCGKTINHAVVLVGYTNDYWIVRNSWGPNWGENGHIKVKRYTGKDPCQLTRYWSQPIEVGEWDTPVLPDGTFINNDDEINGPNLDCDGCPICECEEEDDDDDDEWELSDEQPLIVIKSITQQPQITSTKFEETHVIMESTSAQSINNAKVKNHNKAKPYRNINKLSKILRRY